MSISKMLSGKQADLMKEVAELDSKGPLTSAGQGNRTPVGERTAPGKMALYVEETRTLQTRVDELEAKLKEGSRTAQIDVNDLVIVPGRQRHLSPQEYQELKANLAKNPLASAVTVRELENGRFELISGHNRVQVYRELGRSTIRADIVEADEDAVERMAFYANLLSPALAPYDKYLGLKRRAEKMGLNQAQLAEESGLPRPTITNHFAFERLDPRVLAIVETATDRSYFGVAAAQMFATVPADQMDLAVELARQVAEGVLTTAGAAAKFKPRPALAKSKPIRVRHGSQVTCSIQRKGMNIIVAVKDESFMDDELLDDIRRLLQERSKIKKGSE